MTRVMTYMPIENVWGQLNYYTYSDTRLLAITMQASGFPGRMKKLCTIEVASFPVPRPAFRRCCTKQRRKAGRGTGNEATIEAYSLRVLNYLLQDA